MAVRHLLRSYVIRAVALATGALVLLPAPAAALSAAEPAPPRPRPAPPRSLLDGPGTKVRATRSTPDLPEDLSALSWLVADADTGEVIAARNAHRRLPPASTLKTLFAVTVLPHLDPRRRHTATDEELADVGEGSSLVGVSPGLTYRVADLWRGVFLMSGNDAVHVLAAMNGGLETTVRQMQDKARALGARDTRVVTPDGYDEPGQVSSAYDLAVFGRAGLRDPDFVRYCSTAEADFPGDGYSYPIMNTNRLLTGADGVGRYPGLIGVKNGYTSNAGYTLIAAARHEGRTLLVTVMNPQSDDGQAVYEEARELLDWGFDAVGSGVRPVGSLLPPSAARPAAAAEPTDQATQHQRAEKAGGGRPGETAWPVLAIAGTGSAVLVSGVLATGVLVMVRRRNKQQAGGGEPA
ncbi:D-alanyl-D-alanine carboxypeptidase [Streptomyces sp. PSKA54]|uniref:D-alanyl-D-alanine carboxypeptidase n=1 Tax=Streptomyces himalayensis subsp. aureolus TaxID=2758039 RepID=A0A7W2HEB1_9ACTN|nr:serine hydrolase [Streptomyces himalayensis]MBA4860773.1 D-alanyl-D-alanine carboxypeptidase [Streptomyces himalayensis subsp. aureolus]